MTSGPTLRVWCFILIGMFYIEKYVRYPALITYSTQGFKGTYRTRPF